ncbi:MAG: hypothetical protein ACI81T_002273 [Bacteroidia bacterium]|jgi:hypothetical protein
MKELTLAESKILLNPTVSGLELLRLSLMELIYDKKLLLIKNRAISKSLRLDYFLELNAEKAELEESLIFTPFANPFQILKKFQIGVLFKDLRKEFNNDFGNYKTDFVVKNLTESHYFVEDSIFDRMRGKINLSEKGLAYKSELENELAEKKENTDSAMFDSSILLLSSAEIKLHLTNLDWEKNNSPANSNFISENITDFATDNLLEQVFSFSDIFTNEAVSLDVSSAIDGSFLDGFSFDGLSDFSFIDF